MLLGFDIAVVACQGVLRRFGQRLSFLAGPFYGFGSLALISTLAYLPLLVGFGSSRWVAWAPLAVQASRVLLYAAYFAIGMCSDVGKLGLDPGRAVLLQRISLAVLLFALVVLVQVSRIYAPSRLPQIIWLMLYGLTFALFCAAVTGASLALFGRFRRRYRVWDSLSANAYGIYLLHYPFVVWGQYVLLRQPYSAISKATLVFWDH